MKNYVNTADYLINLLLEHYDTYTISELAPIINTTQQTISSWKSRNAVNAIKKKCRELGIYDEIFGENTVSIIQGNNSRAAGRDYQEGVNSQESIPELEFEETTISLIKDLKNKIGEEELQFKLMELKRNVKQ